MSLKDPTRFDDPLLQMLTTLSNRKESGKPWTSDTDISADLMTPHGISIHWRSIRSTLLENPKLVSRRKRKGRWEYQILKTGEQLVLGNDSEIIFVNPAAAVQATVSLHEFLKGLTGIVRICDPYIDYTTIEHLDACKASTELPILTRNVKDTGDLRRLIAASATQGRKLQIRVVNANVLHDRYIIDDAEMRILGTSLNGFAKKQCFIVQTGEDFRRSMLAVFDSHWSSATNWP